MNALCHKLLAKLHIGKHTTLVESCSEEFLPIMSTIHKTDLHQQRPDEVGRCRQAIFKETLPSSEQLTQQQPTSIHNNNNANHYCGDNSSRGQNPSCVNGRATHRWSPSRNLQEFDFTLYDLNGHGRVTKDDVAGLVRTIYERIGSKIDLPRGGARRIRVKLEIVADDRPANDSQGVAHEIPRTRPRSPIRVAFDEEQLLYETLKQQQYPMTDLRSSQKCNHHSPSTAGHTRTAKKVLTSEALRLRHSVPITMSKTFMYNNSNTGHQSPPRPPVVSNTSPISAPATPLVTSHAVYTTVGSPPFCVTTTVGSCTDTASTAAVVEQTQVGAGHMAATPNLAQPHKTQQQTGSRKQHNCRRRRQLNEKTEKCPREKPERTSDASRIREKFVLKSPYNEEPVLKGARHTHQQLVRHVHHHYHHIA